MGRARRRRAGRTARRRPAEGVRAPRRAARCWPSRCARLDDCDAIDGDRARRAAGAGRSRRSCSPRSSASRRSRACVPGGETRSASVRIGLAEVADDADDRARPRRGAAAAARELVARLLEALAERLRRRGAGAAGDRHGQARCRTESSPRRCRAPSSSPCRRRRLSSPRRCVPPPRARAPTARRSSRRAAAGSAVVAGDERLLKVTTRDDLARVEALARGRRAIATVACGRPMGERLRLIGGSAFDAHAFADGVPLVLGGVAFDHSARARRPLRRRRDHPRTDRRAARRRGPRRHRLALPLGRGALRGASRRSSCSSTAYAQVRAAGWRLVNADCILIGEEPRIAAAAGGDARAPAGARSARARSTCARRRPTGSASPAVARVSPRRLSRCSSGVRLAGEVPPAAASTDDQAVACERGERVGVVAGSRRPRPRAARAARAGGRSPRSATVAAAARSAARATGSAPASGQPLAARHAREADGRAEVEQRLRARRSKASPRALLHAADVRVDRQHVAAEGEVADRCRRVGADPGQLGQLVRPALLGDQRAPRAGG